MTPPQGFGSGAPHYHLMAMLHEKTRGNLSLEEQRLIENPLITVFGEFHALLWA